MEEVWSKNLVTQLDRTPDLIPVPPSWMERQNAPSGASTNANINDVYWQKPDGYIITGPSAELGPNGRPITAQAEGLIRRGWKPLVEYSYTNRVNSKTGHRETIELNADKLNTPDRYYWLFRNGGAHLFPIEQIVELHWHIKPPYGLPKSVFPQLDEWDVPDPRWCPQCPGRQPMNSDEQVIKHLLIAHQPMTRTQAQALIEFAKEPPASAGGVAIRKKLITVHQAVDAAQAAASAEIAQALEEMMPVRGICNDCGEPIEGDDKMARARHARNCSAKVSSPAE